eukprot:3587785-Rhodomonas_salina.2
MKISSVLFGAGSPVPVIPTPQEAGPDSSDFCEKDAGCVGCGVDLIDGAERNRRSRKDGTEAAGPRDPGGASSQNVRQVRQRCFRLGQESDDECEDSTRTVLIKKIAVICRSNRRCRAQASNDTAGFRDDRRRDCALASHPGCKGGRAFGLRHVLATVPESSPGPPISFVYLDTNDCQCLNSESMSQIVDQRWKKILTKRGHSFIAVGGGDDEQGHVDKSKIIEAIQSFELEVLSRVDEVLAVETHPMLTRSPVGNGCQEQIETGPMFKDIDENQDGHISFQE